MKEKEKMLEDCGGIPFEHAPPLTTELVFILDQSGSMEGQASDTVGGFNSMLKKQKGEEGAAFVTTVLFNDRVHILHDRLPIGEVSPMTERDYAPCGTTALLDAVGSTVEHIEMVHRYIRAEDRPAHTVFVVTTDGMENSSRTYSAAKVKEMICRNKEKYGWEFLFLAANIDAVTVGGGMGISADCVVNCRDDENLALFREVSETLGSFRKNGKIPKNWGDKLDKNKRV